MENRNSLTLENKVAIITGASKGIGKAIAFAMGKAGAKVVISSRKQDALDLVVDEFAKAGVVAFAKAANVGHAEDRKALIESAINHFGKIDILVNNAATNPVFGPIEDTNESAFDHIINVNLKAPFELSKLVLESMSKTKMGSIIHISSVEGVQPGKHMGMYSVSKSALLMLTRVQANEWGSKGIRVNAIAPGLIQTKFSQALWDNEKVMKYALRQIPLGRMAQPEEVAGLALFLASDLATYVTGSTFMVDGGYLA